MNWTMPLILASTSPRRRSMLAESPWPIEVLSPTIDDGDLSPGEGTPEEWVEALAWLKARSVLDVLHETREPGSPCTVLGADTICVDGARLLGQPADEREARSMLEGFMDTAHDVLTGACLVACPEGHRLLFHDRAVVRWGSVSTEDLDAYLDSGLWRGKAGGYNLIERIEAGWPIECEGDPATVMGLPMRRLQELLEGVQA